MEVMIKLIIFIKQLDRNGNIGLLVGLYVEESENYVLKYLFIQYNYLNEIILSKKF